MSNGGVPLTRIRCEAIGPSTAYYAPPASVDVTDVEVVATHNLDVANYKPSTHNLAVANYKPSTHQLFDCVDLMYRLYIAV